METSTLIQMLKDDQVTTKDLPLFFTPDMDISLLLNTMVTHHKEYRDSLFAETFKYACIHDIQAALDVIPKLRDVYQRHEIDYLLERATKHPNDTYINTLLSSTIAEPYYKDREVFYNRIAAHFPNMVLIGLREDCTTLKALPCTQIDTVVKCNTNTAVNCTSVEMARDIIKKLQAADLIAHVERSTYAYFTNNYTGKICTLQVIIPMAEIKSYLQKTYKHLSAAFMANLERVNQIHYSIQLTMRDKVLFWGNTDDTDLSIGNIDYIEYKKYTKTPSKTIVEREKRSLLSFLSDVILKDLDMSPRRFSGASKQVDLVTLNDDLQAEFMIYQIGTKLENGEPVTFPLTKEER